MPNSASFVDCYMISGKSIYTFLLIVLIWGCQPQGYPEKANIDWEAGIYLKEGANSEIERYVGILDAESIEIYSELSSEETGEEEYLTVLISQSLFLSKKTSAEKKAITKRLAFLILSRLSYPYAYPDISIFHNEDPENQLSFDFHHSYSLDEFEIDMEVEEYFELEEEEKEEEDSF